MAKAPREGHEEAKLLHGRHPELSRTLVDQIVSIANQVRNAPELTATLSVRATEEACIYLKHPLMESDQKRLLPEVLKSSFCGRFAGRWSDVTTDAGAVWAVVQRTMREGASGEAAKK